MAGLAGVLVLQGVTGSDENAAAVGGKPDPVKVLAKTAELTPDDGGRGASLAQRDTSPFSMLGVTWTDPGAHVTGTVEARTRASGSGEWSPWLRLDGDSGQGESGAARGGTEPAWVGPSNGVEVRMRSRTETFASLPAGLRLDMVDPGTGKVSGMEPAAFSVEESELPTPTEAPTETVSGPSDPSQPTSSPEETVSESPTTPPPPPADESPSASPTGSGTPSPSASASVSPSATVTVPPAPRSTAPKPPIVSRAG